MSWCNYRRSPFYPKYDGWERILIRCLATFELERARLLGIKNREL